MPRPQAGVYTEGQDCEGTNRKIVHSKHLEELNIPRQKTAKYCLMYTIKIISFCRPTPLCSSKGNTDKSTKDANCSKIMLSRITALGVSVLVHSAGRLWQRSTYTYLHT